MFCTAQLSPTQLKLEWQCNWSVPTPPTTTNSLLLLFKSSWELWQCSFTPYFTCFPTNQYHNCLYRWHVLEQRDIPDPGRPPTPYYSSTFFSLIKDVKENTPLNVARVTVNDWYRLLLEKRVTHTSDPDPSYSNWSKTSFQQENALPELEKFRQVPAFTDTTAHQLDCTNNSEISTPLLSCLRTYFPSITTEDIVALNIPCSESLELPVAWLVSTCLGMSWEAKLAGKRARLNTCKAELIARVKLLKSTKWKHYQLHNSAVLLEDMINLHFI